MCQLDNWVPITVDLSIIPENIRFCIDVEENINFDYPGAAKIVNNGKTITVVVKNSYYESQMAKNPLNSEIHVPSNKALKKYENT